MNIGSYMSLLTEHIQERRNTVFLSSVGLTLVIVILSSTFASDLWFKIDYVDSQISEKGEYDFVVIKSPESLSDTILASSTTFIKETVLEKTVDYDLNQKVSYSQFTSLFINAHIYNSSTGEETWPNPGIVSMNHSLMNSDSSNSRMSYDRVAD